MLNGQSSTVAPRSMSHVFHQGKVAYRKHRTRKWSAPMVCPVEEPQALFFGEEREACHFLWFIHRKTARSEIEAGLLSSDPTLGRLLSAVRRCAREITEKTGIVLAATKLWLAHLFVLTAWTTRKSPADTTIHRSVMDFRRNWKKYGSLSQCAGLWQESLKQKSVCVYVGRAGIGWPLS